MEIFLVYIIIINLKGNSHIFMKGGLFVRIIFLKDFNSSESVVYALQTSNHRILAHLALFSV